MFCPIHGCDLRYVKTQPDVAVSHDIYFCEKCCDEWEWTEFGEGRMTMVTSGEEVKEGGGT